MDRHKNEAGPVDLASTERVVMEGDADLTSFNSETLPRRLRVKGRAVLSKELIYSLCADQQWRDFALEGPITIRGATDLNPHEQKELIIKLQAIPGSEIHESDEKIVFE